MCGYNEIAVTTKPVRGVQYILLREKTLSFDAYCALFHELQAQTSVPVIAHTNPVPGAARMHFAFKDIPEQCPLPFSVSVHSAEEAAVAAQKGAEFLIAGHIFATQSKPGLPPRGLVFLENICRTVTIPVYAIGGITPENARLCIEAGAHGICRMGIYR